VNLSMMRLLVGKAELHYLPSIVIATATAGMVNFLLSEFFVFLVPKPRVC